MVLGLVNNDNTDLVEIHAERPGVINKPTDRGPYTINVEGRKGKANVLKSIKGKWAYT